MLLTEKSNRQNLEHKYRKLLAVTPRLNRRIVSFQANKEIPFYNWFAFKEGFSYQMVSMFLKDYPKGTAEVFDPFAGSCTTLFAANEMELNSTGIELLPIGPFVLKSKLAANKVDRKKLGKTIAALKQIDFLRLPTEKQTDFCHIPITYRAFPPETQQKINAFTKYVADNVSDQNIKQVLKFACFSILEKVSYTRKDGQFLRWDYRAGKCKTTFNKGKVYPFEEALFLFLDQILADLTGANLFSKNWHLTNAGIDLKTGSCLEIMPSMETNSFDIIISSPPYCNRYDYTRTYALELVFLGIDAEKIKQLRQSMLSCTVENKNKQDFLRHIYESHGQGELFLDAEKAFEQNKALQEVLRILKDYRDQKRLNNPGIYRMVKNYFYEHAIVIFQMARLLKPNGRIYYVNDNVRYAGETIPVDLILSEFAGKAGLKVRKIFVLERGKGNSSQQMGVWGREELRKCVYFWEKS